ncbi:hypothetical protein F5Y04DRAFT_288500 [Hypomontagnella monticulosa]|nr:hypothetical protein F5Y04DRAFT_288500 [Hypomontagnella monticulosa]
MSFNYGQGYPEEPWGYVPQDDFPGDAAWQMEPGADESLTQGHQSQPWGYMYNYNVIQPLGQGLLAGGYGLSADQHWFPQIGQSAEAAINDGPLTSESVTQGPPNLAVPTQYVGTRAEQPLKPVYLTASSGSSHGATTEGSYTTGSPSESQPSSQATILDDSSRDGRGRKASSASGSSSQGGGKREPKKPAKRPRILGRYACDTCRQTKSKCVPHPGSSKCYRCNAKNLECVRSGVDNRTNKTKTRELVETLENYQALVLEFLAVLRLVSIPTGNAKLGTEALRAFENGLTPTQILENMKRSPTEFVKVPYIKELEKYRQKYVKLEDVRAAIQEVKEAGLQILCSLYVACTEVVSDGTNVFGVELKTAMIMSKAEQGSFTSKPEDMNKLEDLEALYENVFKPSELSLQAIREQNDRAS